MQPGITLSGERSSSFLFFLDKYGNVITYLVDSALLQGSWDSTADQSNPPAPILYVSNVLSGTVTRINLQLSNGALPLKIVSLTQVGSGFGHRLDPAVIAIGMAGALFGIKIASVQGATSLIYVDDNTNAVVVLPQMK